MSGFDILLGVFAGSFLVAVGCLGWLAWPQREKMPWD